MEKEFIAQYKTSYQITQVDFVATDRTLKIDAQTKIIDLLNWFNEENKNGKLEIKIIEL